ncbi:NAD-dependent epimerase/dehydratase family protein [Daejeonella sp. H1SJ63]|jgi:nucleoside-diphosphate-sugar epimerase|uniref:NAD-dependent epimerase/dehydratase family protein n=1 Tax=Daejeonella sp. H1SJ63 TaxID=3034145 RepID=UPI0023EAF013|nr:NAD-dependent epimerase/dehydratase family protein [Daejeonella sp. H1SJ63]
MILVTGGTGFLGSELIRQLLLSEEKVRAIKRAESRIPALLENEKNIEWVNADILDYFSLKEAMEKVSRVYHCAAMISFDSAGKKKMHKINVEGTVNLLNISMENNISRFLHVSSIAALGNSKKSELITENDQWEFSPEHSNYSISKYESEMEVFRAAAEGLNAVIVNPSIIIGKNAGKKGSGQLFEKIRTGLNYYPGGSSGYVDVEDVARAMILLMNSDITDERFIINSENRTYKEIFTEAAINLGKTPPSVALKPWMMHFALLGTRLISMLSGKKFNLTRETAISAFKKRKYSNEKIKKTLNLDFKPISDSIREICIELNTK